MESNVEQSPELEGSIPPSNRRAAVSAWLGILSFVCCLGPIASAPGVILAHLAVRDARRHRPGAALTWPNRTGLLLNYCNIVVVALLTVLWFELAPVARQHSCLIQLYYQCGPMFAEFALDSPNHVLPELSSEGGLLMFTNVGNGLKPVYPDYLHDLAALRCPEARWNDTGKAPKDGDLAAGIESDYVYLGYAISNDDEMKAFVSAYEDRIAKGLRFDSDLDVPIGWGSAGGDKLLRLRQSDYSGYDARTIPVLWDRCAMRLDAPPDTWFAHARRSANVLFLDGHIEVITYPGKWPMTEETVRLLTKLATLKRNQE